MACLESRRRKKRQCRSVQSIIGATEKRRESGAGVAWDTDIGDLESVRLGGGGVYQEWEFGESCAF
jgi:hypothetical protein